MARLQAGVIRYSSVARAIARALGSEPEPEVRIGQWRITITFRGLGASRWPEARQIEHALQVARITRSVLDGEKRGVIKERAGRAVVVAYEDATVVRGCAVDSRWECVIPGAATPTSNASPEFNEH